MAQPISKQAMVVAPAGPGEGHLSADAVLLTDARGRIRSANQAAAQLFGLEPAQLLQCTLPDLLDESRTAPGSEASIYLTRGHRSDGETFPVCVTATPAAGEEGGSCLQLHQQDQMLQTADVRDMAALHEALLEGVNYAFISVGLDGRIIFFNRAAQAMLGYTADEVVGKHTPLLFHDPEEVALMSSRLSAELDLPVSSDMGVFYARESQGRVTQEEYTYVHKTGRRFPVLLAVMALWGGSGEKRQIIGYLGVASDITERRRAEEKLRLSDEVFENSPEAIMITDAQNRIVTVNPAFTRITGYTRDEVVGENPRLLRSGHHDGDFYRQMWERLGNSGVWEGEIWDRRKNGEVYPKWATINVLRDRRTGQVTHYLAMFSDISERKRAEETINFLAHHDPLTNLPNRFTLQARLQQALTDARRHGTQVAVMFIDLDRFKIINDTLGHHVGDLLLIEVSKRISEAVRDSDTVARLGGDEFVVVLSGVHRATDAVQVALKISRQVVKPYWLAEQELHTAASIGISLFPADGEDVDSLMKNADTAMYFAKSQGRGGFQFYAAEMNQSAVERLALENRLRQALAKEEFELYYQPQISLANGELVGFEALLRWNHVEQGMISPAVFIPMAEETGLILGIGEWVLRTACEQACQWQRDGLPPLRMAVNLSVRQFRQKDLLQQVAGALALSGLEPALLELEITESAVMEAPEAAIELLKNFRGMGVSLAVDDFGTGYSSLSYLKLFPINRLKIDRSFVSDIGVDPNDTAISTATIALAHTLGLEVIAEGIENITQLNYLRAEGCNEGQGFLFSKPMAARQVPEFVRSWAGREVGGGG